MISDKSSQHTGELFAHFKLGIKNAQLWCMALFCFCSREQPAKLMRSLLCMNCGPQGWTPSASNPVSRTIGSKFSFLQKLPHMWCLICSALSWLITRWPRTFDKVLHMLNKHCSTQRSTWNTVIDGTLSPGLQRTEHVYNRSRGGVNHSFVVLHRFSWQPQVFKLVLGCLTNPQSRFKACWRKKSTAHRPSGYVNKVEAPCAFCYALARRVPFLSTEYFPRKFYPPVDRILQTSASSQRHKIAYIFKKKKNVLS